MRLARRLGLPSLVLLAGALLPLSFAPFGLWPLGLLSAAALFLLLERDSSNGFWLGWCFGFGKYAVGVSWVYVSIHEYGQASPWLAGMLVLIFAAGLGLFGGLQILLYRAWRLADLRARLFWFVFMWVVMEWSLTWVLTGFPWLLLGNTQLQTPLAGFAPVGGVLLVSLAALLSAGGLALSIAGRRAYGGLPLLLLLLPWVIGLGLKQFSWVTPGARAAVALVQGNVNQGEKWQRQNRSLFVQRYLDLTEPHWDADIIIWPEAAVTYLEHEAQPLLKSLDQRGRAERAALVLGIVAMQREPGRSPEVLNIARVVGDGSGRYIKRRLVPFGEYMPMEHWLRGLIDFFDLPMSYTKAGAWRQPLLQLGGLRAAMAICYEIAYPNLVRQQADSADLLITISNDSWFGGSIGPLQHLEIARMRALENGRYLVRATNNGRTAIIDARGQLVAQLEPDRAAVLRGEIRAMSGVTPFTRFGHRVLGAVMLLLLLLVVSLRAFETSVKTT